jgi:hypothetical protein
MHEWRDPTDRERETIEAVLTFDFVGRDEVAAQIRGARVADDCGCGCGSFAIEKRAGQLPAPTKGPVVDLVGRDETGVEVGLFIMVRDGYAEYIECYGLSADPLGLPDPETLRLAFD